MTFKFKWEGNQTFGNKLTIRDNATNNVVYEETETTMQLKHTVSGNSLKNGKLYNVIVAVIDHDNNISSDSNPVLFYCYTTPTFKFSNITQKQYLKNAAYKVTMTYSQIENEPLQSYEISLYDDSKSRIQSSEVQYDVSDISFMLTSMEDNHVYFVKATGQTLNGMYIETDYIEINVNYEQPAIYSILTLENVPESGYIKIQSNIRAVEAHTNNTPIYIDNEYIDLHNDVLTIDDDFSFDDDFVINASGYNLSYDLIMQLSDGVNKIYLYLRKGVYEENNNAERTYIELRVPVGFTNYYCHSNFISNPSSTDLISFWVQRKNGLFDVTLKKIGSR